MLQQPATNDEGSSNPFHEEGNHGLSCSMKIQDEGQYDDFDGALAAMDLPLSGKMVFRIDSNLKHLRGYETAKLPF